MRIVKTTLMSEEPGDDVNHPNHIDKNDYYPFVFNPEDKFKAVPCDTFSKCHQKEGLSLISQGLDVIKRHGEIPKSKKKNANNEYEHESTMWFNKKMKQLTDQRIFVQRRDHWQLYKVTDPSPACQSGLSRINNKGEAKGVVTIKETVELATTVPKYNKHLGADQVRNLQSKMNEDYYVGGRDALRFLRIGETHPRQDRFLFKIDYDDGTHEYKYCAADPGEDDNEDADSLCEYDEEESVVNAAEDSPASEAWSASVSQEDKVAGILKGTISTAQDQNQLLIEEFVP